MASTGGSARRPDDATSASGRRIAATPPARRRRSSQPAPPADPAAAALQVWTSVVAGLEAARYAEVGTEYAKLSALLAQQRTAQLLAGSAPGPEWVELSRTAQRALDLLEPLLGAARLLATLPAVPTVATAPRKAAAAPPPRRAPSAPRTARKAPPRK